MAHIRGVWVHWLSGLMMAVLMVAVPTASVADTPVSVSFQFDVVQRGSPDNARHLVVHAQRYTKTGVPYENAISVEDKANRYGQFTIKYSDLGLRDRTDFVLMHGVFQDGQRNDLGRLPIQYFDTRTPGANTSSFWRLDPVQPKKDGVANLIEGWATVTRTRGLKTVSAIIPFAAVALKNGYVTTDAEYFRLVDWIVAHDAVFRASYLFEPLPVLDQLLTMAVAPDGRNRENVVRKRVFASILQSIAQGDISGSHIAEDVTYRSFVARATQQLLHSTDFLDVQTAVRYQSVFHDADLFGLCLQVGHGFFERVIDLPDDMLDLWVANRGVELRRSAKFYVDCATQLAAETKNLNVRDGELSESFWHQAATHEVSDFLRSFFKFTSRLQKAGLTFGPPEATQASPWYSVNYFHARAADHFAHHDDI